MKKIFVMLVAVLFCAGCGGGNKDQAQNAPQSFKKDQDYMAAGIQSLTQKDISSAIQNFDMAIKTDPTNVENYLVLGQVYMRLKQYERAIDTFSAAVKVAPNNPEAHYMLAINDFLDGRFDGAEKSAQRSTELFMMNRDEEKTKKSIALLKSIEEAKKQQEKTTQ